MSRIFQSLLFSLVLYQFSSCSQFSDREFIVSFVKSDFAEHREQYDYVQRYFDDPGCAINKILLRPNGVDVYIAKNSVRYLEFEELRAENPCPLRKVVSIMKERGWLMLVGKEDYLNIIFEKIQSPMVTLYFIKEYEIRRPYIEQWTKLFENSSSDTWYYRIDHDWYLETESI